jgi:exodeoxyribonuclease VII small subunit
MNFEENIHKLEKIVKELESEDVDLESAADKYGQGIKIATSLTKTLKKTEEKIFVLEKEAEKMVLKELE